MVKRSRRCAGSPTRPRSQSHSPPWRCGSFLKRPRSGRPSRDETCPCARQVRRKPPARNRSSPRRCAEGPGAPGYELSIALNGEITVRRGTVNQSNFLDYPVARIDGAPHQTNVYVVESNAPPAGVGEPGVSVIAPALANAIFAATGKRIRELTLSSNKVSSGSVLPGISKSAMA
jgi:hypothetical protein